MKLLERLQRGLMETFNYQKELKSASCKGEALRKYHKWLDEQRKNDKNLRRRLEEKIYTVKGMSYKEYRAKWQKKNKKRLAEKAKEYYQKNKEKIRQYQREYQIKKRLIADAKK